MLPEQESGNSRVRIQDVDVGRLDDADTLIGSESYSPPQLQ